MKPIKLKVKRTSESAKIPLKASKEAAGLDLYAISLQYKDDGRIVYDTGIQIEIEGKGHYVSKLYPRSSISKRNLILANQTGIIDSDYRGNLFVVFKRLDNTKNADVYKIGDRIAQLVIEEIPQVDVIEVDEISDTERGSGGFGSTGN